MELDEGGGGGPVRTCDGCYSPQLFPSYAPQHTCCAICLEAIEEGAALTSLLKCEDRQHFHAKCINSWLERNATCPTCRKGAVENPFLKRMLEAPSDAKQQYEGLVALIKTASVEGPPTDRYQNVHRLGEQGACRLVGQAMRTFPTERCIQLLGFEAIEALAAHSEPNRNDLEKEEAERLLYRGMEGFPHDRDLQTAGCQAIVALATGHASWQTRLGQCNACMRVNEMLRRWPQDYATQLAGLYALNALLSRHQQNIDRALSDGVAPLIIHMMRSFWRDLDMLDGAVTALYKLSARGQAERDLLGELDACSVLVAVMAAHPDAHDVHSKSCFTLAKLAWQHARNRQRLMSLGAPSIITRLMDRHPASLAVQMAAAAAIVALYMPLATPTNGNGSTLPPFSSPQAPQELESSTKPPATCTNGVMEAQAFAALVRALATFPDEPELEVSGSPALLFLLEACHGQQPFLEDKDSAARFVRAMQNYVQDEDSQDIYLEVAILVTDEKQAPRQTLLEAGLGSHVLELMRLYTPVAPLMEKCCILLSSLTEESTANVQHIWTADSMAALVSVLTAHPSKSTLQHFGLSCLQNLVEEGGPEHRHLVSPAVLRLVCLALAYHSDDEDIGNASLGLLACLAAVGGVEGEAYANSVMAIVSAIWQPCKQEAAVGCGLLKWLALVVEDCTPDEVARLNGPEMRQLLEEVLAAPHDPTISLSMQAAATQLLAGLPQGRKDAWPMACQVVVEALRTACQHGQLLRSAMRALTALINDNPGNLSALKELYAAEVLVEVSAKAVNGLKDQMQAIIQLLVTQ